MISYALSLRKSEEQIFAIFNANFAVMQIASATHSANFNEKVHEPQCTPTPWSTLLLVLGKSRLK